jgi:hypothetical protein
MKVKFLLIALLSASSILFNFPAFADHYHRNHDNYNRDRNHDQRERQEQRQERQERRIERDRWNIRINFPSSNIIYMNPAPVIIRRKPCWSIPYYYGVRVSKVVIYHNTVLGYYSDGSVVVLNVDRILVDQIVGVMNNNYSNTLHVNDTYFQKQFDSDVDNIGDLPVVRVETVYR